MRPYKLGLSFFYHDRAAVLLKNGDIFAAADLSSISLKSGSYSVLINSKVHKY